MSMIRMEGEPRDILGYDSDGKALAVLDFQVSTAALLPAKNSTFGPYKVQPGSNAQIIQAEEPTMVTMDDDGNWYPEQG